MSAIPLISKLVAREDAVERCKVLQSTGKRVGFTSGVFDILHSGHVEYLDAAKALVDVLVVAVNADSSVRANKGATRPINSESDRAMVVAGLESVDLVYIFGERNNNHNVQLLRPDLYIKAGDYSPEGLSSRPIVESYGGRIQFVPLREGRSTTKIIESIQAAALTKEGQTMRHEFRPAIFVDRDGTINEHVEYLSEPEKFKEIPGSFLALKRLRDFGYRIVVVTNQPGIGLGYFTKENFFAVNREMMRQATKAGLAIDRIYFCPHSKADGCSCRKPGTFLVDRAAADLNLDVSHSFVIGDMTSDVQLAKNARCRGILVRTGRGGDDGICEVAPDFTLSSLEEAAEKIMQLGPVIIASPAASVPTPFEHGGNQKILEAMGKLAGDLGHDFNNILGSVLACVDLIRQRSCSNVAKNEIEDILEILDKAAAKGIGLSDKIRGFIRPGELRKHPISLKTCVEAVIDLLESSRGKGSNLELVCATDPHVDVADFAVTQMLLQLCENLIDAMQHLKEQFIVFHIEEVDISSDSPALELKAGSYAKVVLMDHGKGIDSERQEAVFQPFSSTESRGIGKGLGLSMSMAKAVMRQHGGTLTLSSTKGIGTAIALYFPQIKDT